MDLSRQGFNANMRGGPPGWHPGEPDPRAFHSHPRGNVPYFQNSDGAPRMRGAINGSGLLPCPNYFPTNPNYPPGFDNSRMSPPGFDNSHMSPPGFDNGYRNAPGFDNNHRNRSGFDNSHNFHGEMMFQESLEITSDRPFLPQRRGPTGGPNVTSSSDQGVKVEFCGPSQSRLASVAVKDSNAQEASEGGPCELLPNEKTKKRKKPGAEDAQPAQRSSTAANNYERATKVCHKLWKDLDFAIQQRERDLREKEQSSTQSSINKEVLEEEKKQAAAMKNEIIEERRRLEEEAQRIRKEKDAMERTSTDLAVQMVELKQVQRQLEKEKEALLARKAELSKERCSQERDFVNATVDTPLVAVKAEIEEPVINPCRNCGKSTDCTSESGATPSNIQNQEPKTAMDVPSVSKLSPVASNRNLKSVKAEPVTSER